MKVAIVAPSSVPFRVGGAENFWWGMLHSINQDTPNQADLIKVPSRESNFWELIHTYKYFSELDVSHFDLVISTKYPAWMIQHHNHVCYIQHKLRGLYDTYPNHLPKEYVTKNREISELQTFMACNFRQRKALQEFFERIEQLQNNQDQLPEDALIFPGAFIREIIHFLDGVGLAPNAIRKYCAIANNVVKREDYFPPNVQVETIYHPPIREDFYCEARDYLFTVSRLEQGSKRIETLIQVMKYVKSNIQFKIGGTGSDLPYLKQLAGNDSRIEFIGFVNDENLLKYYANAFAVLYIPYDEDYGLITIEAMMSGKPVITTIDSGGPNEFIINDETGYSVELDPKAIAERIDHLCDNPEKAKQMGAIARKKVQEITWKNTVTRLLEKAPRSRKKITVALTFSVFPPRGGGQSRVYHLYRHLAKQFDVELVTFTGPNQPPSKKEIAPGLWETRVPQSHQHLEAESAINADLGWLSIFDVVMPLLYHLTPAYLEALSSAASTSDFLVASHPYLLPALRDVSDLPLWYEAHNIEYKLKKDMLPHHGKGAELIEATRKVEEECCHLSDLIMVCCENDIVGLKELYKVQDDKFLEVPNGVDLESVKYISLQERRLNQRKMNVIGSFTALFMGSWHDPNIEAVNYILEMAQYLPDVNFIIVGSVKGALSVYEAPDDKVFWQHTSTLDHRNFLRRLFIDYLQREPDPEASDYYTAQLKDGKITRQELFSQIQTSEEISKLKQERSQVPQNVSLMGMVDEEVKNGVLEVVDIALNPMISGSGTNLKMLDYLAAGIPVLSTPFGARGLGLKHEEHCLLAELEAFPQQIQRLMNETDVIKQNRIERARKEVEQRFDWKVIANRFLENFNK